MTSRVPKSATTKRTNYRQLFSSLLDALPLPAFVINREMQILQYNQPALRLYGQTELPHKIPLSQALDHPGTLLLAREAICSGLQQYGKYNQAGSSIAWRVTVTPLAQQKQPVQKKSGLQESQQQPEEIYQYFVITIEDMAELQRLERVQRDFLANISHELRTPLSSVRLLAETLEDTIDTHPEKAQEFVEKIETEVQYLAGLVAELLELSRIESGQLPMSIEPIQAEQLVREAMARMLPLAQRHRVHLSTQIKHGQTQVAADSKLIMRVLVNLVHNAIKFTPSGGNIIISTAPESEHLQSFSVRDTGIGISEEDLSRVFERFYKTDRARAKTHFMGPDGGGTGLGLAIARHIIEAHGGRIMAESIVGQGSTFTFTLPVAVTNL